jgi:hypothetical protein
MAPGLPVDVVRGGATVGLRATLSGKHSFRDKCSPKYNGGLRGS